jgi:L-proline---[L-prolyl-carrier protein] ligase
VTARHLADFLERSADRYANRPAVVDPGGRAVTYAELNRQADALAAFLADRGVKRGDRVGVVLPKSIAAVVAFFASLKAGAAYVPVDSTAPAERSRRILADCDVRAIVLDGRAMDVVPERGEGVEAPAALIVAGTVSGPVREQPSMTPFEAALNSDCAPAATERSPDDLAYIIYTSGSTGIPKGVMITHRNALSFMDWCSSVLTPTIDDRFGSHTPFHFDASVQDIYPAIRHGASLHLVSEEVGRAPKDLARFIVDRQLTIWSSTPSALIMLLQFGQLEAHAPSIRLVSFGGEVFPVKYLRELKRVWPAPVFYNMYGPTETTTTCAFARIPAVVPDDRDVPYPIGFPCSHCQALVLDEAGYEAGPGQEGLLHISGPSVFQGYWKRPEETAAAFLERSDARWYNTGDVVRWDPSEGFTYVGRRDRMVKRRGYRIELGEIERALYQHPRVQEAAVVSIPDPDSGVKIVAFLSCLAPSPSIVELKTFSATHLPPYMVPDRFVFQDHLPKTSTDKVDYVKLRTGLLISAPVGAHEGPR